MSAIVTLTFNPAIDKSTTVEALVPEKKLNCTQPIYEPGGGGINVARAIQKLGGKASAVYFAGGHSGKSFTKLLSDEHLTSILIETKENTRENLMVLETSTKKQYRFGMPGPKIYKREWQQALQIIKKLKGLKYLVISGSLPPNVPNEIFADIAKIVKDKKAKLIIDSSGSALKKAVDVGVYLIKPNLRELSDLVGKEEIDPNLVEAAAMELLNKGRCEIVVVSMGALGAMLVTKQEVYKISTPTVTVNSTVGAGDSMLAGIVWSLANNKSMLETIQYGVACGTAATMNSGTSLCHKKDVKNLFQYLKNQPSL